MLVEPASLCWLAGRLVAARDGVTWAGEFRRWPALRAVVRDGGTGLSKGIELERARRREHQAAALEDGLDVFHTPREGGRALRATWAEASRALERADAARQRFDQRACEGQSNSGHGASLKRLWAAAEAAFTRAEAAAAVHRVLRGVWRASRLVECVNGVARMQQSRHRKMSQGLLDLKRLYWNPRRFRTGPRKDQTAYGLLGLKVPELSFWEFLKLTP